MIDKFTSVGNYRVNNKNKKSIEKKTEKKHKKEVFVPKSYYYNRELSWLKFNERVLDEAMDISVPLCERLSFVSIFQSNLDEFFMVRVGSLTDQMIFSPDTKDNKTGMTAAEQLTSIFSATRELLRKKDRVYNNLMAEIKKQEYSLVSFNEIQAQDAVYLEKYFKQSVRPLLSPQVVGKKNPFPFLKNKEIYAVALLSSKGADKLGIVPCSSGVFRRFISIPSDEKKFILVEELILHFMPQIFDKYAINSKSLIRIIRNADIDVDVAFYDEDLDYRNSMEKLIIERRKLCPVRMEYSRLLDENVIISLCKELKLKKEQIFYSEAPLDLSFAMKLQDCLRNKKELFYKRRVSQNSRMIDNTKQLLPQIQQKDILLSYPYESMSPLIKLLNEAGEDDNVISIKMTLYRVAKNSQIVEALINAAENNKDVTVLVELRARFDEENNIEWSRRLEDAGCNIIYGIDFVKVHSKLCLITYKDGDKIRHITQIGTGNFNEKTAKLYTDLALFTANESIAEDATDIFDKLCLEQVVEDSKNLLVAPKCLQNKILEYIDTEIEYAKKGEPSYVGIKINSLTDKTIIDKLIEASQAGVKIDMVIRGICCIIPKVAGYTNNITVISIVGRFLEHSRIYIFGAKGREKVFISSADFMTRNTLKRVEVAAPVLDHTIKNRILNMFSIMLKDNVKGRELLSDGNYYKKELSDNEDENINSQEYFYDESYSEWEKVKNSK